MCVNGKRKRSRCLAEIRRGVGRNGREKKISKVWSNQRKWRQPWHKGNGPKWQLWWQSRTVKSFLKRVLGDYQWVMDAAESRDVCFLMLLGCWGSSLPQSPCWDYKRLGGISAAVTNYRDKSDLREKGCIWLTIPLWGHQAGRNLKQQIPSPGKRESNELMHER